MNIFEKGLCLPEGGPTKAAVAAARKRLDSPDRSWIDEKPLAVKAEEFAFKEGVRRYAVEIPGGATVHLLHLRGTGTGPKRTVVSLCGGRGKEKKHPMFLRWKWTTRFCGDYIGVEDPMQGVHPGLWHVMWYYGTKDRWFLRDVAVLLSRIFAQLGAKAESVVFLGSSGGGTAACHLAGMFPGTAAVAMNPQYEIGKWTEKSTKFFAEKVGVDLNGKDAFGRHSLQLSPKSRYLLIENASSAKDRAQYEPFFARNGFPVKFGGSRPMPNVATWLHCASDGTSSVHGTNLGAQDFPFMLALADSMRTGDQLSWEDACWLLGEHADAEVAARAAASGSLDKSTPVQMAMLNLLADRLCADFGFLEKGKPEDDGVGLLVKDSKAVKFRLRFENADTMEIRLYSKDDRFAAFIAKAHERIFGSKYGKNSQFCLLRKTFPVGKSLAESEAFIRSVGAKG